MREAVTIDMRGLWARVQQVPDKNETHRRGVTNEQEWMIWLAYPTKPQKPLARELGMCTDTLRSHYQRLERDGGPKGPRPEWMK